LFIIKNSMYLRLLKTNKNSHTQGHTFTYVYFVVVCSYAHTYICMTSQSAGLAIFLHFIVTVHSLIVCYHYHLLFSSMPNMVNNVWMNKYDSELYKRVLQDALGVVVVVLCWLHCCSICKSASSVSINNSIWQTW